MMDQQADPTKRNAQSQSNYTTNLRPKLGEVGDFWNCYDKVADNQDQRLTKNLNDNLDVLLIFAGLFSAVNTSFIQMASESPSTETNYLLRVLITKLDNTTFPSEPKPPSQSKDPLSVRTNCFLYASLCCSILAAVGAMMAKEWLQSFERDGQVGALQDQALRRQRKVNGMQQWRLEPMTRLLPTLLLISVVLFFCGLIGYLFPADDATAGVVMAFAIFGGIFYLSTTSAAAIWDACPYQTSVSKFSSYLIQTVLPPVKTRPIPWLTRFLGRRRSETESKPLSEANGSNDDTEVLSAQAARWLLETAWSLDDQYAAIRGLLNLSSEVYRRLAHERALYERLLVVTGQAIRTWQNQPSSQTVLKTQHCIAALWQNCLESTLDSQKWTSAKSQLLNATGIDAWQGLQDSGLLKLYLSDDNHPIEPPENPASIFPQDQYSLKVITLSMIAAGDIPFWSLDRELAWSALQYVFRDKYDDTIVALVALTISKGFPTLHSRSENVRTLVHRAQSGKDIVANLLKGVSSGTIALSKEERPSYTHALPIFTEILRCLGELPSTQMFIDLYPEGFFVNITRLILAVDGIYHNADSLGAPNVLDEFMDNAQRLLQKFKPPITPQNSMDIIFNGTLVLFVRCNRSSSSTSNAAIQALEWLNRSLGECNFVTSDTVSCLMWGLQSPKSREEVLQLIYTYLSKWGSHVGTDKYKSWASTGLVAQLLKALSSGTSIDSMNLIVPLALRHIVKRATSMSWVVQESEEIMRVGITVINSVNNDTGAMGQAYSLLTFEVVLSVWGNTSEDIKAKQMSGEMVQATKRILEVMKELIGNQREITLTAALRRKIGPIIGSEPLNLSPEGLKQFVSELDTKRAQLFTNGLDAIVQHVDSLVAPRSEPKPNEET